MKTFLLTIAAMASASALYAADVIMVEPTDGDATQTIQKAIDRAATFKGKPVTIKLAPGNYHISREQSTKKPYHISNTSSIEENPDQTKHIGLLFKDLKNVTFDGDGAWLITHGEMTTFVSDGCENLTLKNFTLTSADPSVPEVRVVNTTATTVTYEVTPPSQFDITDGRFNFRGEGWVFADGGRLTNLPEYAQIFWPELNVTNRVESPFSGYTSARRLGDNTFEMTYRKAPNVHVGEYFQIRHGIRNEACGFISMSRNFHLENIEFNFLGNFGLVGQYTENLTYDNIRCRPGLGSGRTDAGFADFVQMSGCRGLVKIVNSYFEGAHDDPINIHGTHLQGVVSEAANRLTVRFMHGQTFGFQPFFKGDKIEIIDRRTMNCLMPATVRDVRQIDDYQFELTLDRNLPTLPEGTSVSDIAVENVTWTPDVEIRNNYFARIPTRGILITTRGKSVIEDNIFFRMPMPSILVSDDARNWYESGPVRDLTIRRNTFIECGSPVIAIWPENARFDKPVHSGIRIVDNRFIIRSGKAVSVRGSDNITVEGNVFDLPAGSKENVDDLIESSTTTNLKVENNRIVTR
ncbi:MAG: right-handed parallel beta-helix repeat-containing protein [Clostridium sp.]|nr:right-handed parallel beta-helix repeat-containing protein [Clostridium sp.]